MLAPALILLHLATTASAQERWAGHQVTVTTRKVPLLGTIETRQDVFMLADVTRDGASVRITERPCTIGIQSGRRVALTFAPDAVRRIPPTDIAWKPSPDALAATWSGGWRHDDVDGDGEPGFLVTVDAPICRGTMSVSTGTSGFGRAVAAGGGLDGRVRITLDRDILGTSNLCLALVPKHADETVDGWFSYRPVAASATCDGLLSSGWPVHAPSPSTAVPALPSR